MKKLKGLYGAPEGAFLQRRIDPGFFRSLFSRAVRTTQSLRL
jgi:hypothetical protein